MPTLPKNGTVPAPAFAPPAKAGAFLPGWNECSLYNFSSDQLSGKKTDGRSQMLVWIGSSPGSPDASTSYRQSGLFECRQCGTRPGTTRCHLLTSSVSETQHLLASLLKKGGAYGGRPQDYSSSRVLKSATIQFDSGACNCAVRNLSDAGAALTFHFFGSRTNFN